MPQFNKYKDDGRRLMVEFTCHRCKTTLIEELEPLDKKAGDHYGNLSSLGIPDGWCQWNYSGLMLCDGCTQKLKEFMESGINEALGKEPTS